MFHQASKKFSGPALLLLTTLLAAGCGTMTAYRATPEDTRDLAPAQARKLLLKGSQGMRCGEPPVTVTHEKIQGPCVGPYRFADYPALVAMLYVADPVEGRGADKTCINVQEVSVSRATGEGRWDAGDCMFYRSGANLPAALEFVSAWEVWARTGTTYHLAQEAAFDRAAQTYLGASVKPQLPEDAVRYKTQAELAVKQKRFDEAADLFEQALGIAPWWPAGRYNHGLILGELQDYQAAIRELQKYLKLEPDAANARAVQLKIYEWESLASRTAK